MSFEQLLFELGKTHGFKAGLSMMLAWLVGHLVPVAGFMLVGAVLVISDWITGVTAANIKKERITSRGLLKSIRKIALYCLAIVLVVIVEVTFFQTKTIVYVLASYIALVELYSNLENISIITGTNLLAVVRQAVNSQLKKVNLKINRPAPSDNLDTLNDSEKNK